MKKFYVKYRYPFYANGLDKERDTYYPFFPDHESILTLACEEPSNVLSSDVKKWFDAAKHGDFRKFGRYTVICLIIE